MARVIRISAHVNIQYLLFFQYYSFSHGEIDNTLLYVIVLLLYSCV